MVALKDETPMFDVDAITRSIAEPLPPIYVVDDHPDIRSSLDALLSSYGFSVTCFADPVEFVRIRRTLEPGIVLLDVRMPGMNGLEVLEAIQAEPNRLQTVLMTAHGEIDLAVSAIKLGAKDFLQKPFREEVLLSVIRSATEAVGPKASSTNRRLADLTPRERDVVLGLSRGIPNKVIAHELGISVRTVEMHRAHAMQRLGCKTFAELLRCVFNSPVTAE